MAEPPVCPALPRLISGRPLGRWSDGRGEGVVQGTAEQFIEPDLQGQSRGRCSSCWWAECASRAGVWISWARTVAVRDRVWPPPARTAAARVRLNAMVAQASQAAFAVNMPEGR